MPPASRSCTASPAVPLSDAPSGLFTPLTAPSLPPSVGPTPSLLHVMPPDSYVQPLKRGSRQSHSRKLSPFRHPSTPEAPFLDGRYPASSVLRASPPPCRPGLPLAGFRLPRARHRHGSRVATLSIFHACRRHYPGGNRPVLSSLSSRPAGGLPLITGGSASASSVSRPARRSLAFRPAWSLSRPGRPFSPEGFSPCRYLHEPLWPLPAGTTVAGWASHPPGKRAFPRRTVKTALHKVNYTLLFGHSEHRRRSDSAQFS